MRCSILSILPSLVVAASEVVDPNKLRLFASLDEQDDGLVVATTLPGGNGGNRNGSATQEREKTLETAAHEEFLRGVVLSVADEEATASPGDINNVHHTTKASSISHREILDTDDADLKNHRSSATISSFSGRIVGHRSTDGRGGSIIKRRSAAATASSGKVPRRATSSSQPNAAWMSGKSGIGYRIPGGVNYNNAWYDATKFAEQLATLPQDSLHYVIINLSSGAFGDQYLAEHSILTNMSRASTPRDTRSTYSFPLWNYDNFDLENYPSRDVFGEILDAMAGINVSVIAYMAAQGPAMLKNGRDGEDYNDFSWTDAEAAAYDYGGNSIYVNSMQECNVLTAGMITDGTCAPSVWKWRNYVRDTYNGPAIGAITNAATKERPANQTEFYFLHRAYAEKIVGEYAERYKNNSAMKGFWFDQGDDADGIAIRDAIRAHMPNAAIAFNSGDFKAPLKNNNVGIEDFTFGHPNPLRSGSNPPDGSYNYGMVLSAESSIDGYVYSDVDYNTEWGKAASSRPDSFNYTEDENPSLAHVFMPAGTAWNNGAPVWNATQAREWTKRVIAAKGAFTWNLRRCGCAGCSSQEEADLCAGQSSTIDPVDFEFIHDVLSGLSTTEAPYYFDETNSECCTTSETNSGAGGDLFAWGCLKSYTCQDEVTERNFGLLDTPTEPPLQCNNTDWVYEAANGNTKRCGGTWAKSRCTSTLEGTGDYEGVLVRDGCPFDCSNCPSPIDSSNPTNQPSSDPSGQTSAPPSSSHHPSDSPSSPPTETATTTTAAPPATTAMPDTPAPRVNITVNTTVTTLGSTFTSTVGLEGAQCPVTFTAEMAQNMFCGKSTGCSVVHNVTDNCAEQRRRRMDETLQPASPSSRNLAVENTTVTIAAVVTFTVRCDPNAGNDCLEKMQHVQELYNEAAADLNDTAAILNKIKELAAEHNITSFVSVAEVTAAVSESTTTNTTTIEEVVQTAPAPATQQCGDANQWYCIERTEEDAEIELSNGDADEVNVGFERRDKFGAAGTAVYLYAAAGYGREDGCNTSHPVPPSVASSAVRQDSVETISSGGGVDSELFVVGVDLKKSNITRAGWPIWDGTETKGLLRLCLRVELQIQGADSNERVPVGYREFALFVYINLEQNIFRLGDTTDSLLMVTADDEGVANETFSDAYNATAYQCRDGSFEEWTGAQQAVKQNDAVSVCVVSTSPEVVVRSDGLDMNVNVDDADQPFHKVIGGVAQSVLVEVQVGETPDGTKVIKVLMQPLFSQSGKSLAISGTVVLEFAAGDDRRRRLDPAGFRIDAGAHEGEYRALQTAVGGEGAGRAPLSLDVSVLTADGFDTDAVDEEENRAGAGPETRSAATFVNWGVEQTCAALMGIATTLVLF